MGVDLAPPRKSLAQARLSGAIYKNPGRYKARVELLVDEPLGEPFAWLKPAETAAWDEFRLHLPWLNKSHRGIVSIAAILAAKMATGELGVPGMTLLTRCLNSMGGTPATSRFAVAPDNADQEDPADRYFCLKEKA
jgi:hypothetical protein